jgi:outer membrane lipoprotein SlyB
MATQTTNKIEETIMNTPLTPNGSRHHPMMIFAALAVILFCLAGTAAIMGWIPSSIGGNAGNRELNDSDRALLASQLAATPAAAPAPALAAAPAPMPLAAPREDEAALDAHRAAERPRVAHHAQASNWCGNCGNVESVRVITHRAQGSGLGAAGGAVLGGLLGHQVGGGNGQKIATVAGAVGGAVVGNQVEGNMKATKSYEIRVRLDNGSTRTFHQNSAPRWASGDRVRIVKGALRSAA